MGDAWHILGLGAWTLYLVDGRPEMQVITCPNDLFIAGSYPIQLTEGIGRFSAPYADANNETHLEQPNQVDEDTGDHGLSALWTWTVSDGPAILHALTDILAEVSFLVHIDLSKVSWVVQSSNDSHTDQHPQREMLTIGFLTLPCRMTVRVTNIRRKLNQRGVHIEDNQPVQSTNKLENPPCKSYDDSAEGPTREKRGNAKLARRPINFNHLYTWILL